MYVFLLSFKYLAKARSALFSIGGVLLGVAVVVVVMSVMNGYVVTFEAFIKGANSDLIVGPPRQSVLGNHYSQLREEILQVKGVTACAGTAEARADLLQAGKEIGTILVKGIDPDHEGDSGVLAKGLKQWRTLKTRFRKTAAPYPVFFGKSALGRGGLSMGDRIDLRFYRDDQDRTLAFQVAGLFSSDIKEVEALTCYIPLAVLQELYKMPNGVSRLQIAVAPGADHNRVRDRIDAALKGRVSVRVRQDHPDGNKPLFLDPGANLIVDEKTDRVLSAYSNLRQTILSVDGVAACAGSAESIALIHASGTQAATILVKGIDPVQEGAVGKFAEYLKDGITTREVFAKAPGGDPILVGAKLLGGGVVSPGDGVDLIFPVGESSQQAQSYSVTGTFSSGFHDLDSGVCYIPLDTLQEILGTPDTVSQINVAVKPGYDAQDVQQRLATALWGRAHVMDWSRHPGYQNKLLAVRNERTILLIVSMFVVVISGFVVMARLFLTVVDKTRDIGILGALGSTRRAIVAIFLVDGLLIGGVGAILGIAGGKLFVANLMQIASFIERTFNITVFSPRIYKFDLIPAYLSPTWTVSIGAVAILWTFLISLIPAALAARKNPVETLRYE